MLTSDFIRTGGDVWTRADVGGNGAGDDDQYDPGSYLNSPSIFGAPVAGRTAGIGTATVSDARTAGVAQMVALTNTPMGSRQRVPYSTTTAGHIAFAGAFADPSGADIDTVYQFGAFGAEYTFDDDDDDATPNFLHAQALAAAFGAASAGGSGVVNQLQGSNVTVIVAINGVDVINIDANDVNQADPNGNWTVNKTVAGVTSPPLNAGAGFNQFTYGVAQIFEGDIVTIFTTTAEAYQAAAGNLPGNAQYNFATTANAWVFVRDTATPIQNGDVDMDGDVDRDDFNIIAAGFPTNSFNSWGDFDGDSDVEVDDLNDLIAAGYPSGAGKMLPPSTLQEGDADHDGDVDRDDFGEWLGNAPANILLVSEESNVVDANYSFEHLSLREALSIADDGDTILFAPWVDEITLGGTQLTVADDVTIVGPGADSLTIDANGASRVFSIDTGVEATISGLTITGGNVTGGYLTGYGGGIFTDGDLTLTDVDLIGNHASHYGGAVFVHSSGTLTAIGSTFDDNDAGAGGGALSGHFKAGLALSIEGSTFSNNTATSAGGGAILHYSNIAGATSFAINNTTFSGNSAYNGGAIQFQNPVGTTVSGSIVNSTVAYNTATSDVAGGLFSYNGATITLDNTIVAKNTAVNATYQDVWGSLSGGGASSYNLIGQVGSSGLTNNVSGNKVGTASALIDPLLAPLGDYGGRTKTHALKISSPALEAGKNSLTDPYDQRGYQREYGSRDIGAYEAGIGTTLIVRSDGDRNDSISSSATVSSLRLREALALSAALAGKETIIFDQTGWADGEIDLTLGQLSITQTVNIDGPGADILAVDAQSGSRVFNVGAEAQFRGLTIKGGSTTGSGGGIYSNGNTLTIDACEFDSNYAANGGGIYFRDGDLAVSNSAFYDNHASSNGAGIYLREADKADITNTTLSGNVAGGSGGGIYNTDSSAPKIINATIAYNQAATGGGIYNSTAGILLSNSIVAQNTATTSRDIHGTFSGSSKNNFIGFDSVTGNGIDDADSDQNQVGGEGMTPTERSARLAPLGYYGGPTKTHALYFDSLAIDNGNDTVAASWSDFDQRGSDREVDGGSGGGVDIGAFEVALGEMFSD